MQFYNRFRIHRYFLTLTPDLSYFINKRNLSHNLMLTIKFACTFEFRYNLALVFVSGKLNMPAGILTCLIKLANDLNRLSFDDNFNLGGRNFNQFFSGALPKTGNPEWA